MIQNQELNQSPSENSTELSPGQSTETKLSQEPVHVHGPQCQHGHHHDRHHHSMAQTPITRQNPKVGRNDPCPCGSQLKFKKCHGK